MAAKKMSFLTKMGSNAKPNNEALATETKEDVQKDVAESAAAEELPAVEDAPEPSPKDATDETAEKAADVKQINESPSPKKTFLPSKFNFSPGRKGKKEPGEAALFHVACESGSKGDCDDDMSVEVSMAAADKGVDVGEEDETEEEDNSAAPKVEASAHMSALEKLKYGGDDVDIDLKELANELKGKFTGVFRRGKSVKSAPLPEPEIVDTPKSLEEADVNIGDEKPADEVPYSGNGKNDNISTTKKATFMSKFFKSDDNTQETAPSVASKDQAAPVTTNEEVADAKKDEPGDTDSTVCEEVKKLPHEDPINDRIAKLGMRSKFSKLFSKNDVSSADTTKNEAGTEANLEPSSKQEQAEIKNESDLNNEPNGSSESEQNKRLKSKFMGKLGIAAATGAVGAGAFAVAAASKGSASQDVVTNEKQTEVVNTANDSKPEEQVEEVSNAEQKTEHKKGSVLKTKFMGKLGITAAAGASGVAAVSNANKDSTSKAVVTDGDQTKTANCSSDIKPEELVGDAGKDGQNSQPMKEKGFKSKIMKKLGIAGAVGAAGVAATKASSKDESGDSLGIIVHSDKPVSEALANGEKVSEPQSDVEDDSLNELNDSATLDETLGGNGVMRRLSTDDGDDCSDYEERGDTEHSRCGFGDDIHEALMSAGECMYETCGDPDFGTAKKMLGLMESTENVICGKQGSDEKKVG